LDVSLEEASVCVMDEAGRTAFTRKVEAVSASHSLVGA